MKVKWVAGGHSGIKRKEIVRETEKCVWVKRWGGDGGERRESKISNYECWFDTFEEAKRHLLEKQQRLLADAVARAETAKQRIAEIDAMQEPQP